MKSQKWTKSKFHHSFVERRILFLFLNIFFSVFRWYVFSAFKYHEWHNGNSKMYFCLNFLLKKCKEDGKTSGFKSNLICSNCWQPKIYFFPPYKEQSLAHISQYQDVGLSAGKFLRNVMSSVVSVTSQNKTDYSGFRFRSNEVSNGK